MDSLKICIDCYRFVAIIAQIITQLQMVTQHMGLSALLSNSIFMSACFLFSLSGEYIKSSVFIRFMVI